MTAPAFRASPHPAAAKHRAAPLRLALDDPRYPPLLAAIHQPPPTLDVLGDPDLLSGPAVALVGSRRASREGLLLAERLAADLAARGLVIVSGLAFGIDAAAHRGALATGRTVAVLASGVDVPPGANRDLYAQVAAEGALVSEFARGLTARKHHFLQRNRIISGLALGTVVVEAAERSGALITARLAGELGREVYAVPGNVSSEGSQGTNSLIRDGARLTQGWEDVVAEWPADLRGALRSVVASGSSSGGDVAELPAPGRSALLELLGDEPVAIDTLVEQSRLPSGQASAELIALERRGLLRRID